MSTIDVGSLDSQFSVYVEEGENDENSDSFLIEMVKNHRIIYDKKTKGHFKAEEVENAWQTISVITRRTVPDIKGRWRSLRDAYVSRKKKIDEIIKYGGSPSNVKEWEHFKALQFLDGCISHRRKTSNTSSTRSNFVTASALSNPSSSFDHCTLFSVKDDPMKEIQRETPSLSPTLASVPPRTTTPLLSDTDQAAPVPYIEKAEFKKRFYQDTITSAMTVVADAIKKNCQSREEDPDLLFGHSIGLSLSKAKNKRLKSKIKIKIMELIAKLEGEED